MYQIKDWDKYFENNRSRTIESCSWVGVPNKMGLGLRRLLAKPSGAASFGIFILIVERCSQQRMPRKGFLSDDGKKDGALWTVLDVCSLVLRPETEVRQAFDDLCDPGVNFLIDHSLMVTPKCPPSDAQVTPKCMKEGREEVKEGRKVEGREINTPLRPPRGADRFAPGKRKPRDIRSALHAIGVRVRGDVPSPIAPLDFAKLANAGHVRAVAGVEVHGFGGQNASFVIVKDAAGEEHRIPAGELTPENIEIGERA